MFHGAENDFPEKNNRDFGLAGKKEVEKEAGCEGEANRGSGEKIAKNIQKRRQIM